ncbi:histone deacetylase [Polychaeton citri CBS 116435]|uniref:Histone deacetylase n=1 Tax=Polychaeton citri CBS 116435 TaxID=1314669 RepID=A0A9P4PZA0_9PEZI|nr:histone deacetylase [Polychaeton citri CBS 116435]
MAANGALNGAESGQITNVHDILAEEDAPRPPRFAPLPYSTSTTGLVYDVRMRFHVEPEPDDEIHPEDPRRIHAIFEAFVQAGLAWNGRGQPHSQYQMGRIDARLVTKQEVCLVHTDEHWEWVQQLAHKTIDELVLEAKPLDSIYMSPSTPYCAALSAGGAIEACRAVMLGQVKNVFAVIRPPGHHAEREDAKGFCFFDNVSIATKVCQREFGDQCRRVFILDWDVHHGNGIQQANYDDPNVLYISLHVHLKGRYYPELSYKDGRGPYGDHVHCGEGAGLGKNVNIPWSKQGMGDADYIYAFQQVVMPIATEFNPDLVIIAAGFDAAEGDMLGGCKVTPAGYAHMTHMLMSLAGGKLAVCLEGGYNLESIARSACAVGRTMMGEPPDRLHDLKPTTSAVDDIKLVLRQQSRFWKSLYPKDITTRFEGPLHGERMHNVVRKWQASTLWDDYEMAPLFIHREKASKTYENQVLATPYYMEARPLLIILHDPPEMLASPDPRTGRIELHNTWLTDVVKTYIEWATKNDFSVIDVSLPKVDVDDDDYGQDEEERLRIIEATGLLKYLWDNYVAINEAEHVFIMGTNLGHSAALTFIKQNEESARERLSRVISFVEDVSLQACRSLAGTDLDEWYSRHSQVYVARDHNFWASEFARKPKRRFGRISRSNQHAISDMLYAHKQSVFDALSGATEDWRASHQANDKHDPDNDFGSDAPGVATDRSKLPPISNFALTSPNRVTARSPRLNLSASMGSPQQKTTLPSSPTKIPPGANFNLPTAQGANRSAER